MGGTWEGLWGYEWGAATSDTPEKTSTPVELHLRELSLLSECSKGAALGLLI